MPQDLPVTLQDFEIGPGRCGRLYSLPALEQAGVGPISSLPVCLRIVLEALLRHQDGLRVTPTHVTQLANWEPTGARTAEIPFMVARVILQDFTGVPLLCDLAAMRTAAVAAGRDPALIEPLVPVDLVIDHSVQVDVYGMPGAVQKNMELEFARNRERYEFLKWGMQAFDTFRVIPPGIGIVHQVNLEYLFHGVRRQDDLYFPDTLVGTDSHTTMINGVGVVGWGVGGIEAEAAMLGQPVYFLTPDVTGVELTGRLREGVTATDLVLTITQMLRQARVVGQFVEFFGDGAASLGVTDRATIANMAPEYGATLGFFPVDDKTVTWLRQTGRSEEDVQAFETWFKAQGLFGIPEGHNIIRYTRRLALDLGSIEPSLAGPRRPQDRITLAHMRDSFINTMTRPAADGGFNRAAADLQQRYPTQLPGVDLGHGDILIAAITSCTNTSNPTVMIMAGLLAQKAVQRGLRVKRHIKTSLAPGSRVVVDYLGKADLLQPLEQLGFAVAGFGCTTCIGNSGDLPPELNEAILAHDIIAAAILSGNRNFEARIHPNIRANYLASPPLVVAFAIAGRVGIDLEHEPLGHDAAGQPVWLREIWPGSEEVAATLRLAMDSGAYRRLYGDFTSDYALWNDIAAPTGKLYHWPASSYIARPPFVDGLADGAVVVKDIVGARALLLLGDSVTTDHISPAGSFKDTTPAGQYLQSLGVQKADFNSYGARRGHHEVMLRGTFANVRLKNLLLPPTPDGGRIEGGFTLFNGQPVSVFEAATRYRQDQVPTVIFAGEEYGTGSSRDWAAKGTRLLGVKAVIARSFERIHRANLVGMGVLPLQWLHAEDADAAALAEAVHFDITGLQQGLQPMQILTLRVHYNNGTINEYPLRSRIDTPIEVDYFRQGGILPYVLRQILHHPAAASS